MQDSKTDMLLKGVCCLMLLQINGESKGEAQIRTSQKETSYLGKGFPVSQSVQIFPREALPVKSEVELQSDGIFTERQPKFASVMLHKKGKKVEGVRFLPKKMNLPYGSKRQTLKRTGKLATAIPNKKTSSFQWTRISTQRGGKALVNRSVANRLCSER